MESCVKRKAMLWAQELAQESRVLKKRSGSVSTKKILSPQQFNHSLLDQVREPRSSTNEIVDRERKSAVFKLESTDRIGSERNPGGNEAVEDGEERSPGDFLLLQDDLNLPSDTLVAIKLIRSQFPVIDKVSGRPFVLQSQLYTSVADRTEADRELEALRREHVVRVFKLASGQDDHAIMLTEDYDVQVAAAQKRGEAKGDQHAGEALGAFAEHVLPARVSLGISHNDLIKLLGCGGLRVRDGHVSSIMHAGLVVRQLADPTSYWFAIPDIGFLLKNLVQGRREMLGLVARRKHGEILLRDLNKHQLRYSKLGTRFHMRDLLGNGHLVEVPTTAGSLLRLARH